MTRLMHPGGLTGIAGQLVVVFFPPFKVATALGLTPPPLPPVSTRIASVMSIVPVPPHAVAVMSPGLEKSLRISAPVRSMIVSPAQSNPTPEAVNVMF